MLGVVWEVLEPLLPVKKRRYRHPGRKPIGNREALSAIAFVLKTGIPSEYVPQELGWGCGMTAWRRLQAWQTKGVWKTVHHTLLAHLQSEDKIDWSRVVVDSSSIRALHGGNKAGRNPTDRGHKRTKHHIATDAIGIPLPATLTGANEHDVTHLIPLVDAIPAVRGGRGRPRRRPQRVQGDRAYGSKLHRAMLRQRGIEPVVASRNTKHGSGLGTTRRVGERTVSWLHQMRKRRVRTERRLDIHEAFMALGCTIAASYFL